VLIRHGDGKIINLMLNYHMFAIDNTRVEAWFVNSRDQSNFTEESNGVLFPEAWRFWVALHSRKDWNNVVIRNRGVLEMDRPPLTEGTVRSVGCLKALNNRQKVVLDD
jgi:hypothetical protein